MAVRPWRIALFVLALLAASAPAGAQELEPQRLMQLSDEENLSRWAHAESKAPVRPRPDGLSRTKTRLRFDTEDGLREIYIVLRSYRHPDGSDWVEIRLPKRPNGQTGWVRREALGAFHRVYTMLRIDRRRLKATLFREGKPIWSSRVGVGAAASPTPAGRFYIRGKIRPQPGGPYGPVAFATSAYSVLSEWPGGGVVGVHGTNQPELIPGRPSHGCVRLPNAAIWRLAQLLPNGTPVHIV
jgi:hypothetical protein